MDLYDAVAHNDFARFQQLLPTANKKARTDALMLAAQQGKRAFIIGMKPISLDLKELALAQASQWGHTHCVQELLPRTMKSNAALIVAMEHNQKEVFDYLLPLSPLDEYARKWREVAVDHNDPYYLNALLTELNRRFHWVTVHDTFQEFISMAGQKGQLQTLSYFLQHPLRPETDNLDMTFVMRAGNEAAIEMMIPYASVQVCTRALARAAAANLATMCQILLTKADAKFSNSVALRFAVSKNHFETIDVLFPHSDPHVVLRDLQENGHKDCQYLEECIQQALRDTLHETAAHVVRSGMARKI